VQRGYDAATAKPSEVAEVIPFVLARPDTWPSTRSCCVPSTSSA